MAEQATWLPFNEAVVRFYRSRRSPEETHNEAMKRLCEEARRYAHVKAVTYDPDGLWFEIAGDPDRGEHESMAVFKIQDDEPARLFNGIAPADSQARVFKVRAYLRQKLEESLREGLEAARIFLQGRVGEPVAPFADITSDSFSHFQIVNWTKGVAEGKPDQRIFSLSVAMACTTRPDRTGGQGRPSSRHLVLDELDRRIEAGELEPNLAAQSEALEIWLNSLRPRPVHMAADSIGNAIRAVYRDAKKAAKSQAIKL